MLPLHHINGLMKNHWKVICSLIMFLILFFSHQQKCEFQETKVLQVMWLLLGSYSTFVMLTHTLYFTKDLMRWLDSKQGISWKENRRYKNERKIHVWIIYPLEWMFTNLKKKLAIYPFLLQSTLNLTNFHLAPFSIYCICTSESSATILI